MTVVFARLAIFSGIFSSIVILTVLGSPGVGVIVGARVNVGVNVIVGVKVKAGNSVNVAVDSTVDGAQLDKRVINSIIAMIVLFMVFYRYL